MGLSSSQYSNSVTGLTEAQVLGSPFRKLSLPAG